MLFIDYGYIIWSFLSTIITTTDRIATKPKETTAKEQ
jgi:hypothetical protein